MTINVTASGVVPAFASASADDRLIAIRKTLAADGITLTPTDAVNRSDGRVYALARSGQPDVKLPLADSLPVDVAILRSQLAMGILPPLVTAFAQGLSAVASSSLTRLLTTGSLHPEEEAVRYSKSDKQLFRKINSITATDKDLEAQFGDDFGDGPGVLTLKRSGDGFESWAAFAFFGTRQTKLDLG